MFKASVLICFSLCASLAHAEDSSCEDTFTGDAVAQRWSFGRTDIQLTEEIPSQYSMRESTLSTALPSATSRSNTDTCFVGDFNAHHVNAISINLKL